MSRGFSSAFVSLLLALTLAIVVSATPVVQVRDNLVRLPIAKKFNFTGSSNVLARDQARVKLLHAQARAKLSGTPLSSDAIVNVPVDNQVVSYIASVSEPCQTTVVFRLIVRHIRSALATLPPFVSYSWGVCLGMLMPTTF